MHMILSWGSNTTAMQSEQQNCMEDQIDLPQIFMCLCHQ